MKKDKLNSIEYNGQKIQYELVRAKIKNLYIHVNEGKVIVKAPLKLKDKEINIFLNKKASWISKAIKKEEQKQAPRKITSEDIKYLENAIAEGVNIYTKKINEYPNKVRIRDIKYAWGTCSAKRNITINMKLAIKSKEEIYYVILHELCHLKYMNHSEKFWKLVEKNMPEYKIYRKRLKNN